MISHSPVRWENVSLHLVSAKSQDTKLGHADRLMYIRDQTYRYGVPVWTRTGIRARRLSNWVSGSVPVTMLLDEIFITSVNIFATTKDVGSWCAKDDGEEEATEKRNNHIDGASLTTNINVQEACQQKQHQHAATGAGRAAEIAARGLRGAA